MNDSNLNKLIEISGEGAVILRAICDFNLGDTHYKKRRHCILFSHLVA